MNEQNYNAQLGASMRALRKEEKLSIEKAAAKLGIHRNTVTRWERGRCGMTAHQLSRFVALMGFRLQIVAAKKEETA